MSSSQPKIVALVPMKHTSVRVRGKNYRMFQGQPLCYWVLKTLRACPRIDQVRFAWQHTQKFVWQPFV